MFVFPDLTLTFVVRSCKGRQVVCITRRPMEEFGFGHDAHPGMCALHSQVLIRRGELVLGCLCKKTLGTAGGSTALLFTMPACATHTFAHSLYAAHHPAHFPPPHVFTISPVHAHVCTPLHSPVTSLHRWRLFSLSTSSHLC